MVSRAATISTTDYYEVLGVSPDASLDEIRAVFKRQVLETHPDKNPERREWSERRIRELISAYEIIGDSARREEFDRQHRAWRRANGRVVRKEQPFFFRKRDPEARALLVLHHLMHEHEDEAVHLLWEMESRIGRGFLEKFLDRKDYLDSLFLLGEHHLRRKQFHEAALRLSEFYDRQRAARRRRHYFDQAARHLKDLYLRKLPRSLEPRELLAGLTQLDDLDFSPSERRLRFLRKAEAHVKCGQLERARAILSEARNSFPDAKENHTMESLIAEGVRAKAG